MGIIRNWYPTPEPNAKPVFGKAHGEAMLKRKEKLSHDAVDGMKKSMGYRGPEECCKVCESFGPDETMGGGRNDLPARCEANLFWFDVDEGGYCKFFSYPEKAISDDEKDVVR